MQQERATADATGGIGAAALLLTWMAGAVAQPLHACDAIGDDGWRVVATQEITSVKDSAPFQAGGDWAIDRTTRLLPLCNYFNAVGNYSLRSYSLDPIENTERVVICWAATPVAPYRGPCPPK